jgi:hypothetical protein
VPRSAPKSFVPSERATMPMYERMSLDATSTATSMIA